MAGLKLSRRTITAGPLTVAVEMDDGDRIHAVNLPRKIPAGLNREHLSSLLRQLEGHELAIPDSPPFHRKVWQRLRRIPWGGTQPYGGIAAALGNPRASRAVGQACAANPFALIVPCHRVRGAQGPGGFAWGAGWKAKLLELESAPRPRR
ncbi:MAG: MGMT family protein [Chthoniobacteraceae bacterium]